MGVDEVGLYGLNIYLWYLWTLKIALVLNHIKLLKEVKK